MAMDDGTAEAPDQSSSTSDSTTGETNDTGIPEPPPPPAVPTFIEGVHGSGEPFGGGSPTPQFGNPKIHIST